MDWQSLTAAAIVALTAAMFLVRFLSRRKAGKACGSSCHCAGNTPKKRRDPTKLALDSFPPRP